MTNFWGQQLPDPPAAVPSPPPEPAATTMSVPGTAVPAELFAAAYTPGRLSDEQPETD